VPPRLLIRESLLQVPQTPSAFHPHAQRNAVRPLESIAETRRQLQPALLRLSAITSQYFIRFRAIVLMIMPVGLNCGFEFEKGRQLLIGCTIKRPASLRFEQRLLFYLARFGPYEWMLE
jgi:hypothetical protein